MANVATGPKWLPTLAFVTFALLIALRDILSELFLSEDPICFAFLVCSTIAGISGLTVAVSGRTSEFLQKLRRPRATWNALLLGLSSSLVYGITFLMVRKMGAGLFNLVDYGLMPLLTMGFGVIFFRERLRPDFFLAFGFYLVGILLLVSGQASFGAEWVALALVSPVSCAAADGLTKWFLNAEGGALSRSELLIVRFFPAALYLGVFILAGGSSGGFHFESLPKALLVSVTCGFVPLFLLCTGLGRKGLAELAVWEFMIPAVAFFGTLPARWEENAQPLRILGASLVIFGILAVELKWGHRLLDQIRTLSRGRRLQTELTALEKFIADIAELEKAADAKAKAAQARKRS